MAALDLADVTLVGNDTGGAICQFIVDPELDADSSRVTRLVLANCDAFDQFPPPPFTGLFPLLRNERRLKLLAGQLRLRPLRHSWLGYGLLAKNLPPELTRAWIEPARTNAGVRRDAVRLFKNIRPQDLLDLSTRLRDVKIPVTVIWGMADRAFKPALGRRLHAAFTDAELIEVPGARTLLARSTPPTSSPTRSSPSPTAEEPGPRPSGRPSVGQKAASASLKVLLGRITADVFSSSTA